MSPMVDQIAFFVIACCAGFSASQRWWGPAVFNILLALHALARIMIGGLA